MLNRILGNEGSHNGAGKKNFFQPKLTINQPGDHYEQEADAMADKVMRMNDNTANQNFFKPSITPIQRKCQQCEEEEHIIRRKEGDGETQTVTGQTENYIGGLSGKGRSLTPDEKSFFEPRFGYDFSGVQLHTDTEANQSAKDINALAYTHGNHIVFGSNQYQPRTQDGNRLMAHELTHVVQQSAGAQIPLQRKPGDKDTRPEYQKEADELLTNANKRTVKTGSSSKSDDDLPVIKKYEAFVEAVVKNDKAAIPALLKDFLQSDVTKLPKLSPTRKNMAEIIAKLFTLGLSTEAEKLEQFFPPFEEKQSDNSGLLALKTFMWQAIAEKLPDASKIKDVAKAADVADTWTEFIRQLIKEISTIPAAGLKKEQAAGVTTRGRNIENTLTGHLNELNKLVLSSFIQFQVAYQVIFEKAVSDLESTRKDDTLKIAKQKLAALSGISLTGELLDSAIDTSKTKPVSTGGKFLTGRYVDYFMDAKDPNLRTVNIEFFNVNLESSPSEKSAALKRIQDIRNNQIAVLEHLYGFEKEKGALTAETKENAAAIDAAKGLKLEDDESWRKFLLQKYEANKKANGGDKVKAYQSVMEVIRIYMAAFTTHTSDNILDSGPNQLGIKYPRALTGQLIHDCGVYALRATYMLSLLRDHKDLQLVIRFIRLPQHTSLIITGDGLPTYFIQNNQFVFYEQNDMVKNREKFDKAIEKNDKKPPPKNAKEKAAAEAEAENEFLGEMAADLYIHGADQPYRMQTVDKDKPITKDSLWNFYLTRVVPDVFANDISPRYHFILDVYKDFYNKNFVPFWNDVVFKNWTAFKPKLIAAKADIAKAKPGKEQREAQAKFDALFNGYKKAVFDGFTPVEKEFAPVGKRIAELNLEVRSTKGVTASNAKMSNSDREIEMLGDWTFQQKDKATDKRLDIEFDPREMKAEPLD